MTLSTYLNYLPMGFSTNATNATWVWYSTQKLAVIPGSFNRTPNDPNVRQTNQFLNTTNFVTFEDSFFDIIGPNATVEHVITLPVDTNHEASCYVPEQNALFFAAWGFDHSWQYLLDKTTLELRNITTDPPTLNAHGCIYYQGSLHIATDGGLPGQYGSIVQVNATTLKAKTLINNFYQQPFLGFNDLDIDPNGNFWISDSESAWGRYMTPWRPQTMPAVYFINATTLTPKWVFQAHGNTNGIAFAEDGTLYVDSTGISSGQPNVKDSRKTRALYAYDTRGGKPQLRDQRLCSNSISYYCDGVRVSRYGYVFCAAGDGVDVIEPINGATLGRIRVAGTDSSLLAVNIAFQDHTLWIVGHGGVWRATGIREMLTRKW